MTHKNQWLRLSSTFPYDDAIKALMNRWGPGAGYLWACLLTAAKRHRPQGEYTWVNDTEALRDLTACPVDNFPFTFTEYLRYSGKLGLTKLGTKPKQTSINPRTVRIVNWDKYQTSERTGQGRWPETSTTTRNTQWPAVAENRVPNHAQTKSKSYPEKEIEKEKEKEIELHQNSSNQDPVDNPVSDITELIGNLTHRLTTPDPLPRDEQIRRLKELNT